LHSENPNRFESRSAFSRDPEHRWAPRTIDLDLLFFDDEIIRTRTLLVPHPRLHERRFVLQPLSEIAPNHVHPIKGVPIKALLKKLEDNKKVIPLYKFSLSQSSEGVLKKPLRERL
jgi:2-amino-4-hydroxy-6-hydroxymethyldihydropteridine diphosphokinase